MVEGGPERPPNGQDEGEAQPDEKRGSTPAGSDKKNAPAKGGDVPPWYQPESGAGNR